MSKSRLASVLPPRIFFLGCVLGVLLAASALHAQAPDPTNPDWETESSGPMSPSVGDFRFNLKKTGDLVEFHAYVSAASGAPFITDGLRRLELRRTGTAPRAITRYYSLYEHNAWGMGVKVTPNPQPQTIPFHAQADVYGQLVVIWALPTTQEPIRWYFIQLLDDQTIGIPGIEPVPNWVPQFAGWRVDAPYAWQAQKVVSYPAGGTANPNDMSKGFFMWDAPGIRRINQVLPDGFLRARAYFRTWLYGALPPPASGPLERFITGEFRWGYWRQFWSDGHEPHIDILGVQPVTWQQYSKTLPAYRIWYMRVLGHAWWPIDQPSNKSCYLPHPE